MDKKPFKSIYIHNGCRSSKVIPTPKKKSVIASFICFMNYRVNYLMDINESMMDAEILKASVTPYYHKTTEHAFNDLYIKINDLRIQFWFSFLQIIIKLSKKLKIYD